MINFNWNQDSTKRGAIEFGLMVVGIVMLFTGFGDQIPNLLLLTGAISGYMKLTRND